MLTEYETQKLLDQMKQEQNASPGVVVKCVVMLLLLFVLAWIGSTGERDHSTPYASHISPVKERASRTAFEERRRHSLDIPPDYPGEVEVARAGKPAGADEAYRPVSASDWDRMNSPPKE